MSTLLPWCCWLMWGLAPLAIRRTRNLLCYLLNRSRVRSGRARSVFDWLLLLLIVNGSGDGAAERR